MLKQFEDLDLYLLVTDLEPVMANNMYQPIMQRVKGGRRRPSLMSKPELVRFKNEFVSNFLEIADQNKLERFRNACHNHLLGIDLSVKVTAPYKVISYRYGKPRNIDSSGFIKSIEDAVVEVLGIDDKFNRIVVSDKALSFSQRWQIECYLKICELYKERKVVKSHGGPKYYFF